MSDAQEAPLLEVRNLSKTFPGQVALAGVDFDVRAGEVHAIVGQNGSGKSTLVKLLAGFHHPDAGGEIRLREVEAGADPAESIGFVHQDLALVDALSALENVALGYGFEMRHGRIDLSAARKSVVKALQRFGRDDIDVSRPVGELAPVERSLIAMARAIGRVGHSSVLVLDEPTAALPAPEVGRLFDAVKSVQDDGGGIIYVSHRLDEVFALADRVTVLRGGRRIATLEISEVDHDGLVEMMLGRALERTLSKARPLAPDTEPLLKVESLSGGAIQDVSFGVGAGEVVGVAGLVGSGREQLALSIIGGIPGTSGSVWLDGEKIKPRNPYSTMRAGIAMAPADRGHLAVLLEHTVAENITLPLLKPLMRFGSLRSRIERAEVLEWIDRVALEPRDPDQMLGLLSGGNQQKAVLARWLRREPKMLILDEPTQGVDVGAKAAIHELLLKTAQAGTGLLICTAEAEDLPTICSRVLVMRNGRIGAELRQEEVSDTRIGHEILATDDGGQAPVERLAAR
jgi:ribose transport system ATP-binding protein